MVHMALTGDFSMPNRADLMSLSTISKKKDQVSTSTYDRFSTIRNTSNNLVTGDIDGKSFGKTFKGQLTTFRYSFLGAAPKLHGSKKINKAEFSNQNWDIDRSGPRALHIGLYKQETNLKTDDI